MKIFLESMGMPFVGMGFVFTLMFGLMAMGFLIFSIIMLVYMLAALTMLILGIVFTVLGNKEKQQKRAMGYTMVKSKKASSGTVFLCIGIPMTAVPVIWLLMTFLWSPV